MEKFTFTKYRVVLHWIL